MRCTRPYVLRIGATMATSPNQQGVVGADSGAIWMWTEACVILRVSSPFKLTCVCFVDLLRRHLFLTFYNDSPLLSTLFLNVACLLLSRCATRGTGNWSAWRSSPRSVFNPTAG